MDQRWGVSPFSVGKFLSHSAEKFRGGTFRCLRESRVSKNFMNKGRGVLRFSVGKFFVSSYRNIS